MAKSKCSQCGDKLVKYKKEYYCKDRKCNFKVEYKVNSIKETIPNDYYLIKAIKNNKNIVKLLIIISFSVVAIFSMLFFIVNIIIIDPQDNPQYNMLKNTLSMFASGLGLALATNFIYHYLCEFFLEKTDKNEIITTINNYKKDEFYNFIKNTGIEHIKPLKEKIGTTGLVKIFETEEEIYDTIKKYLKEAPKIDYDIICCGRLRQLRDECFSDDQMKEYITKGLRIQILTANPNSEYLSQFEIDTTMEFKERKIFDASPIKHRVKRAIEYELFEKFVKKHNKPFEDSKKPLKIKFFNSLPLMQYHRINNHLFVSSSMIGHKYRHKSTISEYIETNNPNDTFSKYTTYFKELWKDQNFASDSPELSINPRLLINNKTVNQILQNACSALIQIIRQTDKNMEKNLNDLLPRLIKAILTIVYDYSNPISKDILPTSIQYKNRNILFDLINRVKRQGNKNNIKDSKSIKPSSVIRRYHTNIAYRNDPFNLHEAYKHIDTQEPVKYKIAVGELIDPSHVIGEAILKGKTVFRKIDKTKEPVISKSRDEEWKGFAVLSVPIRVESTNEKIIETNVKTNVLATISFSFDERIAEYIAQNVIKENQYIFWYDDDKEEYTIDNNKPKSQLDDTDLSSPIIRLRNEARRYGDLMAMYLFNTERQKEKDEVEEIKGTK